MCIPAARGTPPMSPPPPFSQSAGKSLETSVAENEALSTVIDGAYRVASAASPLASKVGSFLAASDPVVVGEYGLGVLAFVYFTPSLLGLLAGLSRCGGGRKRRQEGEG